MDWSRYYSSRGPQAVVSHRDEMIAEQKLGRDFTVINGDTPSLPLPQEPCSPLTTETPSRRAWDFKLL